MYLNQIRLAAIIFIGIAFFVTPIAHAAQNETTVDCSDSGKKSSCDECGAPIPSIKCCFPGETCNILHVPPQSKSNKGPSTAAPIKSGKPIAKP
jgi:hypothetical protein